MFNNIKIDLKAAILLKRFVNYYIRKRTLMISEYQNKLWLSKFQKDDQLVHQLSENVFIYLFKDSVLSKLIYFGHEEAEIIFTRKFLRKGDIFFDIGANIGLYTLISSNCVGDSGSVYAFEPTPITFNRLSQNIKLNDLKNVEINNIGLSNISGLSDFHISNEGYDAWNSLIRLDQIKNSDVIKISVETLDSFIENQGIKRVDLIKLDVEGWEKYVLEGSMKLLMQENPPVFLVEFNENHAFAAGYYCGELFDFMLSFGFEWYTFDHKANILKKENKRLHYKWGNLIAIKNFNDCYARINNGLIE
jgi:FkbM family methyltransferase